MNREGHRTSFYSEIVILSDSPIPQSPSQSLPDPPVCGIPTCLRLTDGADIYQIAKNCRTSAEMIEKRYAAHIKTSLDAAAINIMRPKKNKKGKRVPPYLDPNNKRRVVPRPRTMLPCVSCAQRVLGLPWFLGQPAR